MSTKQKFEITINLSDISKDIILNKEYVPNNLKENIRASDILFIPNIIEDKPLYEVETLDLFNYFKSQESEGLKSEICVADDEFQYRREEAVPEFIALGWFLVKYVVIKPFLRKLKEYIIRKFKKDTPIELKLSIKHSERTKVVEIKYKGLPDHIDTIFSRLEEFWNE
ncbi:MAG: hypothetical protein P8Y97_03220 [Candidatus Lokiarchaeota archaeon]